MTVLSSDLPFNQCGTLRCGCLIRRLVPARVVDHNAVYLDIERHCGKRAGYNKGLCIFTQAEINLRRGYLGPWTEVNRDSLVDALEEAFG